MTAINALDERGYILGNVAEEAEAKLGKPSVAKHFVT